MNCVCGAGCERVMVICLDDQATEKMPFKELVEFERQHPKHAVIVSHFEASPGAKSGSAAVGLDPEDLPMAFLAGPPAVARSQRAAWAARAAVGG